MRLGRFLIYLIVIAFGSHLAWESLHVSLYTGYDGISGPIPLTLWATIGDVLYVLLGVATLSFVRKGIAWAYAPSRVDYFALAGIGLAIALFVEYKALMTDKWAYLPAMPIVPILNVGLTPIVQMAVLLPLCVGLVAYLQKRNKVV